MHLPFPAFASALSAIVVQTDNFVTALTNLIRPNDNVLLVTSSGFLKRGTVDTICKNVVCKNLHLIDDVTPNPELSYINSCYASCLTLEISVVVAVGGGSVMDTAKVLRRLLQYQVDNVQVLFDKKDCRATTPSLIVVPTTAGTGAEITPFATVWDSLAKKKYSVENVQADKILLDPNITVALPKFDTMVTALDALSHALESLWNVKRSTLSEKYAIVAIELIVENLPLVLSDVKNVNARAALQCAALFAGVAISETKTALAHAISYPLTLQFNIPHGLACSFTLASMLKIVGAKKLKLSQSLVDNILDLLSQLQLSSEIREFAELPALLNAVDRELDPSRAGNFTKRVTPGLVQLIIEESMCGIVNH